MSDRTPSRLIWLWILLLCLLFASSALSHALHGNWPAGLFALGALLMVWPTAVNLQHLQQPFTQLSWSVSGRQHMLALIIFVVATVMALWSVYWQV